MTLPQQLFVALAGALGPGRRLDHWFARLQWRWKALWYAAVVGLAAVGSTLASRDHRRE
jgi:hypothetical protein